MSDKKFTEKMQLAGEYISDKAHGAAESLKDAKDYVADKVWSKEKENANNTKKDINSAAREQSDKLERKFDEAKDYTANKAEQAKEYVLDKGEETRDAVKNAFN